MTSKIWELHAQRLGMPIGTTPDGEADLDGLVLSEKAYLLAMRDYRPQQILDLVRREGPVQAARALVSHYGTDASLQEAGGRGLVIARRDDPNPVIKRSDEVAEVTPGH